MVDPAERATLGTTGLRLTRIGFGCAPIGNLLSEVSEGDAHAAIAAAFDDGVRFIDAAPFYGYGLAEERAGRALKGRPRADYVVSTKVGRLIRLGERGGAEVFGNNQSFYLANPEMHLEEDYSYDGVMRSLEESLRRWNLDRIDILHIHDPDDHFDEAINGAFRALDKLRSDGTIAAVSAGMNQWEMLSRFMDHGGFDCFLLAGRYSLLDQTALPEFLPKCQERGVDVIVGGVFNSGLLANPVRGATFNYVAAPDALIERALRLKAICERHGVSLKAAAIQFPLAHPAVKSILSGVRARAEWDENSVALRTAIPKDLWAELKAEGLLDKDCPVPG